MTPKKSNRISRREAEQICSKIRAGFMALRSGYVDAIRGYPVFTDWQGKLSRVDEALMGWVDCWSRFESGLDLGPHDRLRKKLSSGTPLTIAEIDDSLALLNRQQKALTMLPRDFIQDKTNTELVAIELDQLGIRKAA